jgi:ribonucleoside-diphosphate reductase alpha chain
MRFEPSGWTGNPDIPNAKSVPDYIFRWLGMEFIPGYREANAPKRNGNGHAANGNGANGHVTAKPGETNGHAAPVGDSAPAVAAPRQAQQLDVLPESADGPHIRSQQFAKFQADAPGCDNCGAITVRNGNCYLCHNCGNSMGCS